MAGDDMGGVASPFQFAKDDAIAESGETWVGGKPFIEWEYVRVWFDGESLE